MRFETFPRTVANLVGFQATWLACAWGAGNGHPLVGPVVGLLWVWLHLASLGGDRRDRAVEVRLLLATALTGYLFDALLVLGGVIGFPTHAGPAVPTTPWMVVLWMAFGATLRHGMNWARRRYVVGACAGAIFGPFAYTTGEALGAIALAPPPVGLVAVGAQWAVAMPLLQWLRERVEGARAEVKVA